MAAVKAWSIKGIDAKTRNMVKTQARLAGVTIGTWLSDVVNIAVMEEFAEKQREHEQKQQNEAKFNEDLQITGTDGQASHMFANLDQEYDLQGEQPKNNNFNTYQNADIMKNSRNRARYNSENSAFSSQRSGLPRAEGQISKGFDVIENALTEIVDHIEIADSQNSTALRSMQAQIAQLTERTQAEPSGRHFQKDFGAMEGRLANLADRIDELNDHNTATAEQSHNEQKAWVSELQRRDNFDDSAMASRFDELFVKLDNISHQQDSQLEAEDNSEIDEMEQKLARLSERLDSSLSDDSVDPQITELEGQIAGLGLQLSDLLSVPKPEAPSKPVQSAETSFEIIELRDSILQINNRLEKTEQRLGGIDRLEENMTKLVDSVTNLRDNSGQVAQDAATAAVEAFAKTKADEQSNIEAAVETDQQDQDIDAIIAAKFNEISGQNDEAEKAQLSGFQAIQTSLEKVMDRLSRVEDGQNVSASHLASEAARVEAFAAAPPPDDRLYEGASDAQDFTQPGADTNAELPQDIAANQSLKTEALPEATPTTPPMAMQTAISEPAPSQDLPTKLEETPKTAPQTAPQMDIMADSVELNTQPKPATATPNLEALNPEVTASKLDTQIQDDLHGLETNLETIEPQAIAEIEEPSQARPEAKPSSSSDFIAAARAAAQQTFDEEEDTSTGTSKSLFSKIKNAAKRDKNQIDEQPQAIGSIDVTPLAAEDAPKNKSLVKSLLNKVVRKKDKTDNAPTEELANPYAPELPTDIFEDDFFKDVELPAHAARNAGNELSTEAQDLADQPKRKSAAPVVIALFMVTVLVSGVSWYSLRNKSTSTNVAQIADAETQIQTPKIKPVQTPAPAPAPLPEVRTSNAEPAQAVEPDRTNAARAILEQAKQGLPVAKVSTNQQSKTAITKFTPNEFDALVQSSNEVHQPTPEQLEALKKSGELVTNSIPDLSSKPYTSSLLGNSSKFVKAKDLSGVGSSSLSKTKSDVKPQTKIPRVKTAMVNMPKVNVDAQLPPQIGPKQLRQNAILGKAAEQFEIANRYALGYGVDVDLVKSFDWFLKAADNKLAVAQFSVGMMLEHGKGTDRNLNLATNYYQRSAEQGNLMSIYRLAMINAAPQNPTVKPNFEIALKWFNMAADAGLVDAQYNLAVLYEKGHGTDIDLVQTYKWYAIAGNKGDQQAQKRAETIKLELSASKVLEAENAVKAWQVNALPEVANTAPKLAYLVNEPKPNAPQLSQNKHLKSGTIDKTVVADKKAIRGAQKMLQSLGWNVGGADGIMGAKTRKAVSEFQLRHNLLITGEVNDELLANLEAQTL